MSEQSGHVGVDGPAGPSVWLEGIVAALCLAFVGLVIGTAFGATRVPDGSGLAGPAIALGYGAVAAVVGVAIAVVTAMTSRKALRRSLVAGLALALLASIVVTLRVIQLNGAARDTESSTLPEPRPITKTEVPQTTTPERQP